MFRKVLTLVLVTKPNEVLLGYKKRGFGVNKWNGFGGKVEVNESISQGAIRELREESGIVVSPANLEQVGMIDFEFMGDPVILEVHVFTSSKYEGQHVETEEMLPKWFKLQDIPFHEMWVDDKLWFPLFLSGKKFKGTRFPTMSKDHHRLLNVFSDPKRFRTATVKAKILDAEKLGNIGIDMSELRCKDLENIKCFGGPLSLDTRSIFNDNQKNFKSHMIRIADGNRQKYLASIWYPDHHEKNHFSNLTVTHEKNAVDSNIDHKPEKANTQEPRMRFKPIPCDICNREFGSYSISIHRQQCMKKWMSNNNQRPPAIRN